MSKSNDVTELELNRKIVKNNIKKAIKTLKGKSWKNFIIDPCNPDFHVLKVCLQGIENESFDNESMKNLANKSIDDWLEIAFRFSNDLTAELMIWN